MERRVERGDNSGSNDCRDATSGKETRMASTEHLPGTKPVPPAKPSATDDDTEGHAWNNDNETVVVDKDTEGHSWTNDSETVVVDNDTQGHKLASNDDETVVEDDRD
jgi:hypothetical protein